MTDDTTLHNRDCCVQLWESTNMIGFSWIFYFSSSDYRQNPCILVLHRGLVFFSDSACSTLKKGGQKAEINLSRSCSVGWQSRNSTTSVKVAVIFQYLIFDWKREGTIASVGLSIFKLQDRQGFTYIYIHIIYIYTYYKPFLYREMDHGVTPSLWQRPLKWCNWRTNTELLNL